MTLYCGNLANFIIYLLYSITILIQTQNEWNPSLKKGEEGNLLHLKVAVNIFDSLLRSALPFEINANLPWRFESM